MLSFKTLLVALSVLVLVAACKPAQPPAPVVPTPAVVAPAPEVVAPAVPKTVESYASSTSASTPATPAAITRLAGAHKAASYSERWARIHGEMNGLLAQCILEKVDAKLDGDVARGEIRDFGSIVDAVENRGVCAQAVFANIDVPGTEKLWSADAKAH